MEKNEARLRSPQALSEATTVSKDDAIPMSKGTALASHAVGGLCEARNAGYNPYNIRDHEDMLRVSHG